MAVSTMTRRLLVAGRIDSPGQFRLLGFSNSIAKFAIDIASRAAEDIVWNTAQSIVVTLWI
jgi:hypothetical protein